MVTSLPKSKNLNWNEICKLFLGERVELFDLDWDWDKPFPKSARVRHHASDRDEVVSMIRKDGEIRDSVIMYLDAARSAIALSESRAAL